MKDFKMKDFEKKDFEEMISPLLFGRFK